MLNCIFLRTRILFSVLITTMSAEGMMIGTSEEMQRQTASHQALNDGHLGLRVNTTGAIYAHAISPS